jgi:hypothetical protein
MRIWIRERWCEASIGGGMYLRELVESLNRWRHVSERDDVRRHWVGMYV